MDGHGPSPRERLSMKPPCPFCSLDPARIVAQDALVMSIRDTTPVSPGHTLILPKRHVASLFETTDGEQRALLRGLREAKLQLDRELKPDGYNVGINDGQAAGQTIAHLHIHLIPRYRGDRADPRGGVRWIFPEKAAYWEKG
jgi:diadenosine tetraphosphate (Ap4A) HIT family hydrolase